MAVKNKLVILGGRNFVKQFDDIMEFDTEAGKWRATPSPIPPPCLYTMS